MRANPGLFEVTRWGRCSSVALLAQQACEFHPKRVAIVDPANAEELAALVPPGTEVLAGAGALAAIAEEADIVLNGVVGFAGLAVTLAALRAGKRLALANKESLIAAGPLVERARMTPGAEIVPVDSEHCAVHQCLRGIPGVRAPGPGGRRFGGPRRCAASSSRRRAAPSVARRCGSSPK